MRGTCTAAHAPAWSLSASLGPVLPWATLFDSLHQEGMAEVPASAAGAPGRRATPARMPGRDIIVVGTSAGGVEALKQLAAGLPADLPAAVFVVLHLTPDAASVLPKILSRAGPLPASHPQDGEPIRHGQIYVAPPDQHLLVERGRVRLSRGPREHNVRPAVDPLFRSASRAYGPRVIGVILSGSLNDGTLGLLTVKARGGKAVVQSPRDALFPSMPASAIESVPVDEIVPVSEMALVLERLVREPLVTDEGGAAVPDSIETAEEKIARDMAAQERGERQAVPSIYTCPECGGVMWQIDQGWFVAFHCHTGHIYSLQTLLVDQAEALEEALWAAIRSLKEKASLARQMLARQSPGLPPQSAERFREQARAADEHAEILRRLAENPMFSAENELAITTEAEAGGESG